MPNHVTNVVRLKGDAARIQEMLVSIQNSEDGLGSIDFNKIIPMPESLDIQSGTLTDRGLEAYRNFLILSIPVDTETNLDPQNMPQELENAYLETHPDISPDVWALGKAAYRNICLYGAPTWYEWCRENWGTKWNAYDCETAHSGNEITFLTAWSAPHPILQKLSEMYPDIAMEHQWADEDIGANCGRCTYQAGTVEDKFYPVYGRESVEFACKVMGADPSDYNLALNEDGTGYAYVDEED